MLILFVSRRFVGFAQGINETQGSCCHILNHMKEELEVVDFNPLCVGLFQMVNTDYCFICFSYFCHFGLACVPIFFFFSSDWHAVVLVVLKLTCIFIYFFSN